jgi:DEAD/DEAH box helicase domain-containing protein
VITSSLVNVLDVLRELREDPRFGVNVAGHRILPAKPSRTEPFPDELEPRLARVLESRGIRELYSHQAEAIRHVRAGRHIVVVTPTASGKTLCYNLPVLDRVLREPESRALYLFPTKALSADQLEELHGIVSSLEADIKTFTFDGDTPATARKAIRSAGHVIVTNPDMLHSGILPHHVRWVKLFENLRYVVIDEVHHYKGIFGSHLANLIRRLKRLCAFYGSRPTFICCSATVANPGELVSKLLGEEVHAIQESGAPQGEKHLLLYNPPVVNKELGIRQSYVKEAARIALELIQRGVQTIVFTRSRVRVELILTYLREGMKRLNKNPDLVHGYRGGYLPNERRRIEQGLREREYLGVVSTNALELGIDIGGLDASVLAGWPGSLASALQQAGRAGRKLAPSLSVLVASSNPLDQYLVNHPEYLYGGTPESGIVDPGNLVVRISHLKCAAFELAFGEDEPFGHGEEPTGELLQLLTENRVLRRTKGKYYWMADVYPASDVSLRSASTENVVIVDDEHNGRIIGEVDLFSAPLLVHDEAIYLHEGDQFLVEKLDFHNRKAHVRPSRVDYFTDAEAKTDVKVLDCFRSEPSRLGTRSWGEVSVTTIAVLFKKIRFFTHENVGWGKIHLPEQEMQTTSYWLTFDPEQLQQVSLSREDLSGGLKALAHLLRHVVPLFILCDPQDIRVVPQAMSPFTGKPTVYVYDRYPGGVGLAEQVFAREEEIISAASSVLTGCDCPHGCPSCVGPELDVGPKGKGIAGEYLLRLGALPKPPAPPREPGEDMLYPR